MIGQQESVLYSADHVGDEKLLRPAELRDVIAWLERYHNAIVVQRDTYFAALSMLETMRKL